VVEPDPNDPLYENNQQMSQFVPFREPRSEIEFQQYREGVRQALAWLRGKFEEKQLAWNHLDIAREKNKRAIATLKLEESWDDDRMTELMSESERIGQELPAARMEMDKFSDAVDELEAIQKGLKEWHLAACSFKKQ
jgi:predicted  nucleic acid-binding Zn-ribbon protein